MTEKCDVKKVKRGYAYIELKRTEACEGCKICSFNKKKSITALAVCDISVSVGDNVTVEMPSKSVGAAALLVYAIPIALMAVGAAVGIPFGVWWQVGLCFFGLAAGIVAARLIDGAYRKKSGVLPIVKSVIADGTEQRSIDAEKQGQGDKDGT